MPEAVERLRSGRTLNAHQGGNCPGHLTSFSWRPGKGRRVRNLQWLVAGILLTGLPVRASCEARVLTTLAEVHDLPAAEAAMSRPVHVVGTVTYFQPDHYSLFIADKTGGAYVFTQNAGDLHAGDLLDVTGITEASYRTVIDRPTIRVIGRRPLPKAKPADFRQLMAGAMDCQYVSVRGTVRSATVERFAGSQVAELVLLAPGGLIQAYIEDDRGIDLEGLIDSEVDLTGVAGGVFNTRKQLLRTVIHSTDERDLKVLRSARVRPKDLPLTAIDDVLPTRYNIDLSQRVRVRGTVTFYQAANSIVIQHGSRSLLALTYEVSPVPLGSIVDVVGFADNRGYGPMLEEAEVFRTGTSEPVAPTLLDYKDAIGGKYSDNLITLQGTVLSELHGDVSDSMVVLVDQHAVNVSMWGKDGTHLPDLPIGSSVAVTGICRLTPTGAWGNSLLFELDMRHASDVQVVAQPSWWTVAHMLYVLAALLCVSVLITGWAVVLRRRVSRQRASIERTMRMEQQRSRLLEQINSDLPLQSLLDDICTSFGALVSGASCTCELAEDDRETSSTPGLAKTSDPHRYIAVELTGMTGDRVGSFRGQTKKSCILSEEDRETLTVGASLANLAVNQRHLYRRLNYHSTHDQLTALPNRRLSDMRLDEGLRRASQGGRLVGVLYLDVDHFKQVNDQFGHKTGDLYLQEISARLSSQVRSCDLLARIGGDEFMLTAELGTVEDAEIYRQRLLSCFDKSFCLDGVIVYGSASIGVAVYSHHGTTAEELQRHADLDMYAVKQRCRSRTTLHEAAIRHSGQHESEVRETGLREMGPDHRLAS